MSDQTQEPEMTTKPMKEHEWLQNLVGEWRTEGTMQMGPDQPPIKGAGREVTKMFGPLWALAEGQSEMPNGATMNYKHFLGWDVSFKEYRGGWMADVSSHLWKQVGELSADGRTMTLDCVGPHMEKDGETANYRDVIELIDKDHRVMTSHGQDENGNWFQFMRVDFYRTG